jgi:uncharacterized Tic20 family protein
MYSSEEKLLAVLSHASFFLFPILIPLVIFLLKKDSPFVRDHAKEALIFHLATTIAVFISSILAFILIGFILTPLIVIFSIVVTIIAIIKAINGELYRYPITSVWAQKL